MPRIGRLARGALVAGLPLLLSGCLLGPLLSYFQGAPGSPKFVQLEFSSSIKSCVVTDAPGGKIVVCSYGVPGGPAVPASATLRGEQLGNLSSWLDPLILQLPAGVSDVRGTFAGAASGNLAITLVAGALAIDADRLFAPDAGQQLAIIDFPGGAPPAGAGSYQFRLNFTAPATTPTPIAVKAILAGKVTSGGRTYYPPLIPCSGNLATVPTLVLPTASALTPVGLGPLAGITGCNNVSYNFDAPTPATVVEFYNLAFDHYFITHVPAEIAILEAGVAIKGWTRTGRTFKTYTSALPGWSEVCRFYIPPGLGDSHFFGRGTTECNETAAKFPAFTLEDPRFMYMVTTATGVCPGGMVPVYRVFSQRTDANHRYMIDRALRDQMVTNGWLAEGDGPDQVVMCAPA